MNFWIIFELFIWDAICHIACTLHKWMLICDIHLIIYVNWLFLFKQLAFLMCRSDNRTALLLHLLKNVVKQDELTVVFVATTHQVEYINMVVLVLYIIMFAWCLLSLRNFYLSAVGFDFLQRFSSSFKRFSLFFNHRSQQSLGWVARTSTVLWIRLHESSISKSFVRKGRHYWLRLTRSREESTFLS